MIDNVKIKIQGYTGNFDNWDYKSEKLIGRTKGRLYNKSRKDSKAYLKLDLDHTENTLVIENSWRKWYLGDYSLADLTSVTLIKCIEKVARLLNIDPSEIADGTVTQCEIGLNIKTNLPCKDIIPCIEKYSTLKWYQYGRESVGFLGENKEMKLYDKPVEIKDRKKREKVAKRFVAVYDLLNEKGHNFLRMEMILKDRKSFTDEGLNIETLGEVAANYSLLYDFWAREIGKLVVTPKFIFPKEMTWKEYMIARIMSVDGFSGFEDECVERCKNKSAKSRLLREGFDVVSKYADLEEYNKTELRRDIVKNIKRIKKRESQMDFASLINNLWGNTTKKKAAL